jgi:hypothetical protein
MSRVAGYPNAADPLYQHTERPVRQPRDLIETRHDADAVQICGYRILHLTVFLSYAEYAAVLGTCSRFDGGHGYAAADNEGHDGVWKKHYVPQWQYWEPFGDVKDFAIAEEQRHGVNTSR